MHFQDVGVCGRILHLQPMSWNNDWPVIGVERQGKGKGEPVLIFQKPNVGNKYSVLIPQMSDDFTSPNLGQQWQWNANYSSRWYSLTERRGFLRLKAAAKPDGAANLWSAPNILVQKFPAPSFTVTAKLGTAGMKPGEKCGLMILGMDYAYVGCELGKKEMTILQSVCKDANKKNPEIVEQRTLAIGTEFYFRVTVGDSSFCTFSISRNGKKFTEFGKTFTAREGLWVGARIGLFSTAPAPGKTGFVDLDWVRCE